MNVKKYIKNNDTLDYICCLWGILNKCYKDSRIINSIENFDLRIELNSFQEYCKLNNIKVTIELIDIFTHYIYYTANILGFSTLLYCYNNSTDKSIFDKFNYYLKNVKDVNKDNIDMFLDTFGALMQQVVMDTYFKFLYEFDKIYIENFDNLRYKYRYWIRIDDNVVHVSYDNMRVGNVNDILDLCNKKSIEIETIGNSTNIIDFDEIFKRLGVNTEEDRILILS